MCVLWGVGGAIKVNEKRTLTPEGNRKPRFLVSVHLSLEVFSSPVTSDSRQSRLICRRSSQPQNLHRMGGKGWSALREKIPEQ